MRNKACKKQRSGITVGELVPMLDKDCYITIGFNGAATHNIVWGNPLTRYAYGDLIVSSIETIAAGDEVHVEIEVAAAPLVRR